MPLYDYRCKAGHEFEEMKKVADRAHTTCECGESADQIIIRGPAFDPRMGTSPDFPTMAARWDKKQWRKSTGQMHDANQTRYGTTVDHGPQAHRMKTFLES